jgi:glycopeptide antibiotics resistance protein
MLAESSFVLYLACAWALVLAPFPETQAAACARHSGIQLEPFRWVTDMNNAWSYAGGGWRHLLTNAPLFIRLFNVALTLPFGVFLRRWFRRGFLLTVLAGFGLSLAFELTQLTGIWWIYDCAYRTFDVDDLIANTFGAAVGWLVAPAIVLLPKRHAHDDLHVVADHAGIFRRLVAVICDIGLWAMSYVVAVLVGVLAVSLGGWQVAPRTLSLGVLSATFLVLFVIVPAATGGATAGKFLVRLSTARSRDPKRPAAAWQHLWRETLIFAPIALAPTAAHLVAQLLGGGPNMTLALAVGIPVAWLALLGLSSLARKDRRSLADLLSGTVLVVVAPEDADRQAQLVSQRTSGDSSK